jgi:hypothetical protein
MEAFLANRLRKLDMDTCVIGYHYTLASLIVCTLQIHLLSDGLDGAKLASLVSGLGHDDFAPHLLLALIHLQIETITYRMNIR